MNLKYYKKAVMKGFIAHGRLYRHSVNPTYLLGYLDSVWHMAESDLSKKDCKKLSAFMTEMVSIGVNALQDLEED